MRVENRELIIDLIDLDHILDIEPFDLRLPPSQMFLRGLKSELDLNGLDYSKVDSIHIEL